MKDAPNNILENMIGSAQTSRKIIEDGDFPILTAVLIALKALRYTTDPDWDHIIQLMCGDKYNMYIAVYSVPECDIKDENYNTNVYILWDREFVKGQKEE